MQVPVLLEMTSSAQSIPVSCHERTAIRMQQKREVTQPMAAHTLLAIMQSLTVRGGGEAAIGGGTGTGSDLGLVWAS